MTYMHPMDLKLRDARPRTERSLQINGAFGHCIMVAFSDKAWENISFASQSLAYYLLLLKPLQWVLVDDNK